MREKIYFLAKGNFSYEPPELVIEPPEVEIEVVTGNKGSTTFTVSNSRGTKLKGFGFVEAKEITFLPLFDGEKNVLTVEVDASELIAGTTLKGKLILVTDCGECRVPYKIEVTEPVLATEDGTAVRDYYNLLRITQKNPRDGLKLFRDPAFRETFLYRDPEGRLVYDRLFRGNTGLSGMEEFLVAFGKKQPVRFVLENAGLNEDNIIEYDLSGSDIEDSIMINLNTWGSVPIRVEVTGSFIETERRILWTDEFADMKGRLGINIIAGKVRAGNHFGTITLSSPYETHKITIYAHSPVGAKERKIGRAKQAALAMLLRSLIAFREGRVNQTELRAFFQKHRQILERLEHKFSLPLKGYMAWMLDSETSKLEFYRVTETMQAPPVGRDQTTVENYCLIVYIKYMYSGREEDREELCRLIDMYAANGYMGTVLLLLGLRCDTEGFGTDAKKVERLRELMAQTGNSPMLYSELLLAYLRQPELLTELDSLNLRVLLYGLRQDMVSKALADVITVLCEGRGLPLIDGGAGYGLRQDDDPLSYGTGALLVRVLFGIYDKYPSSDTLRGICALLVRYEKRDRRYFSWYERGVKECMRLTDLFEYYMYTVDSDREEPLPQTVLSYFQYENHLNDTRKAFLYANIVRNREALPEVFENYKEQIHEFVRRQVERERVTGDMGYLFNEMLTDEDIIELSVHLPHLMFRHLLICETSGIESVTIVHLQTSVERTYPLDHGKALLDIYTPDYRLFFSDRDGVLYTDSIDYTLERFYDSDHISVPCWCSLRDRYLEELSEQEDSVNTAADGGNPADADKTTEDNGDYDFYHLTDMQVFEPLLFHLTVGIEKQIGLKEPELEILFKALENGNLRDYFHGKVFLKAYDFIHQANEEGFSAEMKDVAMRRLMNWLRPDSIKRSRIGEVAADCIRCGLYEKADMLLRRYGVNGCSEDEMLDFVIHQIRDTDYAFDDSLVKWALALHRRGHRDHPILNYLLEYYMGETDVLIQLFRDSLKTKRGGGTGAAQLENFEGNIRTNPAFYESVRERVLGQVLFAEQNTADTEDIFMRYYEDGDNRVLVKAYLSKVAYEFIVGRGKLSDPIFEKVYRQARYEREPVMILAALKKLTERKVYDENEQEFITRSLDDMAAEGCVLPFMKDFNKSITIPYEIRIPVIIQYYSGTVGGVFLFVKENDEFVSRPMTKVFDGIFVASVLLFAGEETVGYIYEEETGKRSKRFDLKKKEAACGGDSMFEQVNAMLEAKNAGKDEKYERLSRAFVEEQQLAKELFTLL
ncbi:MAG: hypothetical protein J5819_07465 [Eubacterium sp.]|nr:hypothetical protein [Eubacterium sp.]